MKLIVLAAAAATMIATPALANHGNGNARSGTNSPTATNENPSSCLGAERATRNSRGGDRMMGKFGQEQSALARQQAQDNTQGGFGQQTLQPFMDGCEYSPGDMDDDQ
jgi:hypothetical protein